MMRERLKTAIMDFIKWNLIFFYVTGKREFHESGGKAPPPLGNKLTILNATSFQLLYNI
jgi:hypothetical protein